MLESIYTSCREKGCEASCGCANGVLGVLRDLLTEVEDLMREEHELLSWLDRELVRGGFLPSAR